MVWGRHESPAGLNTAEVTTSACRCRFVEPCHIGRSLVDVSQWGPWLHNVEDFSWEEVIPHVSRSAALSEVGQKFHMVSLVSWFISVTLWVTNALRFFLASRAQFDCLSRNKG